MTPLQVVALVVGMVLSIGGAVFAVARVVFVTEVRVQQTKEDIAAMRTHIAQVEVKAAATDREVTGPHSVNQVRLEGRIQHVAEQVAALDKKIDQLLSRGRG